MYPNLVQYVSVTLIESNSHVLNAYDEKISQYTAKQFSKQNINLITNSYVTKVNQNSLIYTDKNTKLSTESPFGLCIWYAL